MMTKRVWLKTLRKKKGYTQQSIADELNVAKTTISSYEQGNRTPSPEQAMKIAKKLDVPWTIFFDTKVRESYFKNKKAGVR